MSILKKLTGIITDDPREQHNLCCYGGAFMLRTAYVPLISGQTMMAFYVALGLSTTQIGMFSSPGLFVGIPMMILSTAFLDRIRKRALVCGILEFALVLMPALALAMTLLPFLQENEIAFYLFLGFGVVSTLFTANYGAVTAMLFSRSIKPNHRGKYFGLTGIAGGLIGIVFSLLASYELKTVGFPYAFSMIFLVGIVLILISAVLLLHTRELPEQVGSDAVQRVSPWEILKKVIGMPAFRTLMPANILRGFGDGAGTFAVVVGMRDIGLPIEIAGYATARACLSSLTANAMIGKLADRVGAGRMIFPTVLLLCAGLIGIVNSTNAWMFLGFYLLWNIMQLMESTEIPLIHYDVVPVEAMGAFSNIRLLCLSLTGALSGMLVGFSLDHFPAWTVFAVCAALKIVSALLFQYGSAAALRHKRQKEEQSEA